MGRHSLDAADLNAWVYADPPLSDKEMRKLATSIPPQAWSSDAWDWAGEPANGLSYSRFIHRLVRVLPDDTQIQHVFEICCVYEGALAWVDEDSKGIQIGLFQSYLNRHLRWLSDYLRTHMKVKGHPDVPIDSSLIDKRIDELAGSFPIFDVLAGAPDDTPMNWSQYRALH